MLRRQSKRKDQNELNDEPLRRLNEEILAAEEDEDDGVSLENLSHVANTLLKLFVIVICLIAAYYGGRLAYRFGHSIFTEGTMEQAPGHDVEVTILNGMSDGSIGTYLQEQGLVRSSRIFLVQAKIYGYPAQPGTYTLNTSQTIYQMLRIMAGLDT